MDVHEREALSRYREWRLTRDEDEAYEQQRRREVTNPERTPTGDAKRARVDQDGLRVGLRDAQVAANSALQALTGAMQRDRSLADLREVHATEQGGRS